MIGALHWAGNNVRLDSVVGYRAGHWIRLGARQRIGLRLRERLALWHGEWINFWARQRHRLWHRKRIDIRCGCWIGLWNQRVHLLSGVKKYVTTSTEREKRARILANRHRFWRA